MYILKLHFAKLDVSSLFCSKVIEERFLGFGSPLLLDKGRVKNGKKLSYTCKYRGLSSGEISPNKTASNKTYEHFEKGKKIIIHQQIWLGEISPQRIDLKQG